MGESRQQRRARERAEAKAARQGRGASPSAAATERAVRELLDPYSERTSVPDGSDRVVVQPGKIIDNLRDRMDRFAIDPLLDVAVEDFVTADEAELLAQVAGLPALVEATAAQAAKLIHRELPLDQARHPVPPEFPFVEQTGLTVNPAQIEIGRRIFNYATAHPDEVQDYRSDEEVLDLPPADQTNVFMVVLSYFLIKISYAAQNRQQR